MLPALNLAQVRTFAPRQCSQFYLSDSLRLARGTHCLPEGLCWLGFKCGCTWGTASLNYTLLH